MREVGRCQLREGLLLLTTGYFKSRNHGGAFIVLLDFAHQLFDLSLEEGLPAFSRVRGLPSITTAYVRDLLMLKM